MNNQSIDAPTIQALTDRIIGLCIEVHRELGPGLLESVYEGCLCQVLDEAKVQYSRQGSVPIVFRGKSIDQGFRYDLMIEQCLLMEIKAVETILPVHKAQVLTYLKLTGCPVGLLVNFHVPVLKDGLRRLINPSSNLDFREK